MADAGIKLAVSSVEKVAEAIADCQAELARREEVLGEGVGILKGNDRAGKAAPGSTNTNWTKFVKIGGILVEGKEPTVGKELRNAWRDVIVKDEGEDPCKCCQTALIMRLVRRGEAIRFEGVGKITKGAICGPWFEGTKCLTNDVSSDGDTGLVSGTMASTSAAMTAADTGGKVLDRGP